MLFAFFPFSCREKINDRSNVFFFRFLASQPSKPPPPQKKKTRPRLEVPPRLPRPRRRAIRGLLRHRRAAHPSLASRGRRRTARIDDRFFTDDGFFRSGLLAEGPVPSGPARRRRSRQDPAPLHLRGRTLRPPSCLPGTAKAPGDDPADGCGRCL